MLPKYYRFHVVNNTGVTATLADGAVFALRASPWKFDSNGALDNGVTITDDLGQAATLADGAASEGDVQDNTSNLYLGLNCTWTMTHDLDAAAGTWDLYIETSDDNTNWPSDANDFVLAEDLEFVKSLTVDNTTTDRARSCNFAWE